MTRREEIHVEQMRLMLMAEKVSLDKTELRGGPYPKRPGTKA
jgi:hypothetical protein